MKRSKLIIRPEAENEIREAVLWYESCVEGLGSEYLLSLDACFSAISRNPKSFPAVHKSIRMALLKRFPYEVFYLIEVNYVIVLAVFHAKRDPKHWKLRN